MKSKLRFEASVPPEIVELVKRYTAPHEWLIPDWCQFVLIRWKPETDDGTAIETEVNSEYRWACMTFCPHFLDPDEELRDVDVIHDFLHISTNAFFDHASNTIKLLMGDSEEAKKFYALEEERIREFHEGMVQDLAHLIQRKLGERDAVKEGQQGAK